MGTPLKPVNAGPFLGMNTRLPAEKLRTEDGAYVRDAVNVDLTDAGSFRRRAGQTLVEAMTQARSIWTDDDVGYLARGADLLRFDGQIPSQVIGQVQPGAAVSFTMTPRGVVWSDGYALGLIPSSMDASRALGVPVPNPVPFAIAASGGSLSAGVYRVAFRHVAAGGERSPLTVPQTLELIEDGAKIDLMLPASTMDTEVFVARDGAVLYRELTIAAGASTGSIVLATAAGMAAPAHIEGPMPAGRIVREHNGRLLVARGDAVHYSDPFAYGITRPAHAFVRLQAEVVLVEPVDAGVFLATASGTWFARGADFAAAQALEPKAPFGAVFGTTTRQPNDNSVWWTTPRGLVRGGADGSLTLINDKHLQFKAAASGAAVFRETDEGMRQVLSVVNKSSGPESARATDWFVLEPVT